MDVHHISAVSPCVLGHPAQGVLPPSDDTLALTQHDFIAYLQVGSAGAGPVLPLKPLQDAEMDGLGFL